MMNDPTNQGFAAALTDQLQTRFLGKPLHFFAAIDSTNTYAARLAREGASEGTVVIADSQSGGKGRLGRSWVSPAGVNLYLSAILRPPAAAAAVSQFEPLPQVACGDAGDRVC